MRFSVLALGAHVAYAAINEEELLELGEYEMVNRHREISYTKPVAQQVSQFDQYADSAEESEEEAPKYNAKEQEKATKYTKTPANKARFEYARDACKNTKQKQRKACFTRNWRLYKPHLKNTVHDYRARAHRKCW